MIDEGFKGDENSAETSGPGGLLPPIHNHARDQSSAGSSSRRGFTGSNRKSSTDKQGLEMTATSFNKMADTSETNIFVGRDK